MSNADESRIEVPSMEVEPKAEKPKRKPGRPRKVRAEETAPKGETYWGSVKVPIVQEDPGYCSKHVEVRLTTAQSRAMKRILLGLQREGVTIGARREPIKSGADVVRYVLDQIA